MTVVRNKFKTLITAKTNKGCPLILIGQDLYQTALVQGEFSRINQIFNILRNQLFQNNSFMKKSNKFQNMFDVKL